MYLPLFVDTFLRDIRAAPVLLMRMFETPHGCWFRRHQSGANMTRPQSPIDTVQSDEQLAPISRRIGTLQALQINREVLESSIQAHCSHGGYAFDQPNLRPSCAAGPSIRKYGILSISGYNR